VLVASFVGFVAGFAAASALAFAALGIWRRNAGAPGEPFAENAAMAGYMLVVTGIPAAAGFALVTSPWRVWRSAPTRNRIWLSAAGGLAAYLAQLTGIAWLLLHVPLPGGSGPIGAAFRLFLPGIVAGLAAVALVSLFLRRPAGPTARS
jgi:hypothetical protein